MNYEQYASLVMPETAILELTEYCNFNCVHCYETHQRESLLDIDDYIEEKARQAPSPRIGEVHQQQCDADDAEGGFRAITRSKP
jgi:MoaA/NifB/PqqE/SkfB family radical SAM enzyme